MAERITLVLLARPDTEQVDPQDMLVPDMVPAVPGEVTFREYVVAGGGGGVTGVEPLPEPDEYID